MSDTHAAKAATDFAVFLRGISNVPMQPFRETLEGLGLEHVQSYGGTGNLVFDAPGGEAASALESRIATALGADAFVRTRTELEHIVDRNPFAGRAGAAVFLAARPIEADAAAAIAAARFEGDSPVVDGATVYFVHPLRHPGRKSLVDLERELGVRGTMRAGHVVARVLALM